MSKSIGEKITKMQMDAVERQRELERAQQVFDDDLKERPKETQDQVNSLRLEVQRNIDMLNQQFFSDDAFERESKLRKWIREITDNQTANITDAEELLAWSQRARPLSIIRIKGAAIIKTSTGRIDRVDKYVWALEKTVLDQHDQIKDFTKLSFFSLIKIAIKRIFKGANNGNKK